MKKGVAMNLFEAIEKRYSCRALAPVDIPREDLETIMDAGRRAASGLNIQPFSFIAITDKATITSLAAAQGFIADASAAIAIVADPAASKYWIEDISAAAENMCLAVTALGYATTWVEGTLMSKEEELKKLLEVPQHLRLMILLPLGKAMSPGSQMKKKPLRELTHWEKW